MPVYFCPRTQKDNNEETILQISHLLEQKLSHQLHQWSVKQANFILVYLIRIILLPFAWKDL